MPDEYYAPLPPSRIYVEAGVHPVFLYNKNVLPEQNFFFHERFHRFGRLK